MSMSSPPPEPWHSFLLELDASIDTRVQLNLIGGFVVTVVHGMPRRTADIDVVEIAVEGGGQAGRKIMELGQVGGPLYQSHHVYIEQVGVAPLCYDYEERLTEVFPGVYSHLILMAADPYDIALSKIERNSPRDRADVLYLANHIPFDLDRLRQRYLAELRFYLGVPLREDLTLNLWIEAIEEERAAKP